MENRITDVLKRLKNKKIISEKKYEDFYPVGSSLGVLCGCAKILNLLRMVFLLSGLFH